MKNLKLKIKNYSGFTLIELIVVIAIISLLSSIVIAGMTDSRIKSQNAATIQQVGEYQTAIGLYMINNQNRFPDVDDEDMHCIGSGEESCLWVGVEIETENSGPLTDLEPYIRTLPFVETQILAGVGTYKGLLYQCNDPECRTANFYWPEFNTSSCTKGNEHVFSIGNEPTNGVLCTQLADGSEQ